jgi:predicted RNase H-like nuclease
MINAMQKALEALERERAMAQDASGNYTIEVTPKHITEAMAELNAAIAASQEPRKEGDLVSVITVNLMRNGIKETS